jgi:hypothetical protein
VFKAICGRDGFTRDFGCGRCENLSGALSWLTFFAGEASGRRQGEAKVIARDAKAGARKLAESTIRSQ